MKMLIYLTPWDESIKSSSLRYSFLKNDFKAVLKNLYFYCNKIKEDFEVRIICPNSTEAGQNDFSEPYITPNFINKKEINYIFSSHKEYMMSDSKNKKEECISFFKKKLDSFTPHIIIALTPCDFIKDLFPNSLYYVMEAGFFSRPPYPITQYFDTNSPLNKTFPVQFKDQILKLDFNQKQQNFITLIRSKYLKIFNKELSKKFISRKNLDPKNKYQYIVLLPLQFENCPSFDNCCDFSNQEELAEFVLENIDKDILLVVTKHDFTDIDTKNFIAKFSSKYNNFLFIENLGSINRYVSQYLVHLVDAVITVSSSIGLQAVFYNKPCICIGNSHIKSFADSYDIKDLSNLISCKNNNTSNKDKLIYYLLTHYYVPFKFLKKKPKWTYDFFKKSMKKKINFKGEQRINFYDRIENDGNLLKFYLKSRFASIIYYFYNMIK